MTYKTTKAPLEIIDFGIDWTPELAIYDPADLVSTSVWTVEDGTPDNLTMDSDYIEGNITYVRVSGGGTIRTKTFVN